MDEESLKARKVQRMAKDLIDIKKNEFTLLLPRHIFHEDDELFVVRNPQTNLKHQRIPPHLMAIPRDANFLVEVFFEVILDNDKKVFVCYQTESEFTSIYAAVHEL
jgi:hypothetical protein